MSNTIKATYLPPDETFKAALDARRLLAAAEKQKAEITRETRRRLALHLRRSRDHARRNSERRARRMSDAANVKALLEQETQYRELLRDANKDCLDLCFSIAREVIGEALQADTKAVENRINKALEHLVDKRGLKVTLHEADASALRPSFLQSLGGLQPEILRSQTLPRGSAVIETASGRLEVNIEEHLNGIHNRLSSLLEEDHGA